MNTLLTALPPSAAPLASSAATDRPTPTAGVQIAVRGGEAPTAPLRRHPIDTTFTGALPPAQQVLAFGCQEAALASRYERTFPGSVWHDVDDVESFLQAPAARRYDLIVLGDGLPARLDAGALFTALAAHAAPRANLVVQLANGATLAALERVIEADFTGDAETPAIGRHTTSSLYKLLMDAGWMPTLAGHRDAPPARDGIAAAALTMADALNIPRPSLKRALGMGELVVRAQRVFDEPPAANGPARFAVVVPTTREQQLRVNVEHSPGLKEVAARIVCASGATDPAQALAAALPHCGEADWVLLCHQDVYFPRGFGHRLNEVLAAIAPHEQDQTLIGFVGMGVNAQTHAYEPAGFVIDRLEAADHPASDRAMSIDELAIVISRRSIHRIDPAMGWHLWATDLCLQSICEHQVFPRIVRMPLFHNSVTDYELPKAFVHAAAKLAAKYPAFKSIPTLCATIDEDFLREASAPALAGRTDAPSPPRPADGPPQRIENGRDLIVDDIDDLVAQHIARGDDANALQAIAAGVHQTYRLPAFAHTALYYPQLDRHLPELSRRAERVVAAATQAHGEASAFSPPRGTLLVATELYALGGHSRVLEDVSHEVPHPVLVLTDLFDTYARSAADLQALQQRFAHCRVVALPEGSCWNKSLMLGRLTQAMRPETIAYFGHHQDPIPFAGTLAFGESRKLLFHHGDHNPSLGCTIDGVIHVDLTDGVHALCTRHLPKSGGRDAAPNEPALLQMHVPDLGLKTFHAKKSAVASAVTSGHPAKFALQGPLALQHIVQATLAALGGQHFHIGPLPDDWAAEIRAHLAAQGLDPARFVTLGLVPSLWQTLKGLDAMFYIGSAPLGGGRAAAEAQGCGYPVAYFASPEPDAMVDNAALYASRTLKWSSPQELAQVLHDALPRHAALSQAARALYTVRYSRKPFRKALQQLLRR